MAKKPSKSAQRAPKPWKYGAADQFVDLLKDYDFRFYAIRHKKPNVQIKGVEGASWVDAAAIMTGSVTIRDPSYNVAPMVRLDEGEQVLCQIDQGGGFRNYWLMRVKDPTLTVSTGERVVELANDLDLLARSTDDFFYPKGKGSHKNGWLGQEIIADVCSRFGVPLVRCPVMKTRMVVTQVAGNSQTPVEVIQTVLSKEHKATHVRYRVRWDFTGNGLQQGLFIEPLPTHSPHLLSLGKTLVEASFKSALPKEPPPSVNSFASAITMRGIHVLDVGKDKKGHAKKQHQHLKVYVESKPAIGRYGYVRRVLWSPDATNQSALVEEGRGYLAEIAKPIKTLSLTEVGMPFLKRGDAIRLGLGDQALQKQVVFVTSTSHTVDPTQYVTEIEVTFDDPYIDKAAKRSIDRLKATAAEAAKVSPTSKDTGKGKQHGDTPPEAGTYAQNYGG